MTRARVYNPPYLQDMKQSEKNKETKKFKDSFPI